MQIDDGRLFVVVLQPLMTAVVCLTGRHIVLSSRLSLTLQSRYALPVNTARMYGCQKMHPYIRAVNATGTYGPHLRVVRIGLYETVILHHNDR